MLYCRDANGAKPQFQLGKLASACDQSRSVVERSRTTASPRTGRSLKERWPSLRILGKRIKPAASVRCPILSRNADHGLSAPRSLRQHASSMAPPLRGHNLFILQGLTNCAFNLMILGVRSPSRKPPSGQARGKFGLPRASRP